MCFSQNSFVNKKIFLTVKQIQIKSYWKQNINWTKTEEVDQVLDFSSKNEDKSGFLLLFFPPTNLIGERDSLHLQGVRHDTEIRLTLSGSLIPSTSRAFVMIQAMTELVRRVRARSMVRISITSRSAGFSQALMAVVAVLSRFQSNLTSNGQWNYSHIVKEGKIYMTSTQWNYFHIVKDGKIYHTDTKPKTIN